MKYFTTRPEGYYWGEEKSKVEHFSIDFDEPSLTEETTDYTLQLGDYAFKHRFEFDWTIERLRHSIEQLCFRHTKSWIDFPFDDVITRLDCEAVSEGENRCGRDLILVTVIPNGYVYEYNRIGVKMSLEECEKANKLQSKTAIVDAKEFIQELYSKILLLADSEYDGNSDLSPEIFRKKFQSNIIEEYLSRGRLETDDGKPIGR